MNQTRPQALVMGVLGAGLAAVGGYALWLRMKKNTWRQVGTISELYIYPIKSGQHLKLQESEATTMGLVQIADDNHWPLRDRYFVVYNDDTKVFISAKTHPKLLKLKVEAKSKNAVIFSYPNQESFVLELPSDNTEPSEIELWSHEKVPTIDCGQNISKWISSLIVSKESGLRVGFWSPSIQYRRDLVPTQTGQLYKKLRNEDTGAYSDLSSFHLLNKASVDNLNDIISTKEEPSNIKTLNFRPNFVVEGASPYEEDSWEWVKIGEDTLFRNFKPCTRCALTTVDPDTGVKNPKYEPIRTLKTYRQLSDPVLNEAEKGSPVMGIYIGLYKEGKVKIGDPVYVTVK